MASFTFRARTATANTATKIRLCWPAVLLCMSTAALGGERLTLNFNSDWRFIKSDPAGAQQPGFDDAAWAVVSAPHTFNDVDTFDDWSLSGHRGEQNQWGGRTWYRKSFDVPADWTGKRVYGEFEGVRHVAEVYLNGQLLGVNKSGFIPFGFDLTPHLKPGKANVLAVMADNRFVKDPRPADGGGPKKGKDGKGPAPIEAEKPRPQEKAPDKLNVAPPAGGALAKLTEELAEKIPEKVEDLQADQIPWNNPHWHPAHGGIYRNVTLHVVDPLHISLPLFSSLGTEGPYTYATDISDKLAKIGVEVPFQNGRDAVTEVEVVAEVKDRDGKTVLTLKNNASADARGSKKVTFAGALDNPQLWEPAYPYLYRVTCSLRAGGQVIDSVDVPLGIRTVKFDNKTGVSINGHRVKLRGWGQKTTNEWPGLGAAQPDWLQFFTLDLMKQAGANFVRWGHISGAPSQIKAGDRLGILALQPGLDGEGDTRASAWAVRAAAFRDLIIYYRNHPSIVIWEGGNQKVSRDHARELRGYMDKYDPHGGRAYAHRRSDKVVGEFMDVCIGTEGGWELKEMGVVEGEYNREESPRRVWDDQSPPNFGYPEAKGMTYQLTSEQFAVNQVLHWMKKCAAPKHGGGANWIFSDSTSGGRVPAEVARASGEVDGVRLPKEAFHVCRVMWSDAPAVHVIGHWTYPAGTKKTVYVAGNGDEVELIVNGKSLGRAKPKERYLFEFPDVAFEPGEIKAVSYAASKPVAEQSKRTAGPATGLRMTSITGPGGLRADGADVVLIDVEAVDAQGNRCPTFEQRIDFATSGPGVWRGGYNSGKINSINNPYLHLEAGINRVAVRASREPGTIAVTATAEGLPPANIDIVSHKADVDAPPVMPDVKLPRQRPTPRQGQTGDAVLAKAAVQAGRFVAGFNYTGPTSGATVQRDAQDGKPAYSDAAGVTFESLPAQLKGADWVQLPSADRGYSAEDLIELQVKGGSRVYVAHDARLPVPKWIEARFKPTDIRLNLAGQPMRVFERVAERDESLTLSSNSEDPKTTHNMYVIFVAGTDEGRSSSAAPEVDVDVAAIDRERIFAAATKALEQKPLTITSDRAKLSEGGANDFYSNGDYWWPNPDKPDGLPYVQRDGQSNPDAFFHHRMAVRDTRDAVAALGAAYKLTNDDRYAAKSAELLRVFFLDPATRMNPHLQYAQAIPGVSPGRGIGIIDALHLIEIPPAVEAMTKSPAMPSDVVSGLRKWFGELAEWMVTSKNGRDEAKTKNNHAVAYDLQLAVYAKFAGDEKKVAECRRRFKELFLVDQMALDGSFPRELKRTKPYAYSIFQLDNMATLAQVLSTPEESLWLYALPDGRGMRKATAFLYPYLADKSKWPHKPDVQAWEGWPARQPALLFAGVALGEQKYIDLWKRLPPDPTDPEVRRNIAITQPVLWVN